MAVVPLNMTVPVPAVKVPELAQLPVKVMSLLFAFNTPLVMVRLPARVRLSYSATVLGELWTFKAVVSVMPLVVMDAGTTGPQLELSRWAILLTVMPPAVAKSPPAMMLELYVVRAYT